MEILKMGFKNLYLLMIVIACSIPIIFGFCFIEKYGVDVPFWDQWVTIVPWTIQYHEGNFDLINLIDLHNDSRSALPNIITFIISLVTNLNIKVMFYIGYMFFVVSIILIVYFLKEDINFDREILFFLVPIFYYAFNPYYMIRFIHNQGSMEYPILVLTALITIYLLHLSRNSYFYFIASIFTGFLCTFSFVAGLSIWLSGLVQLGIQNMNYKMSKISIWTLSAIAILYIYFIRLRFTTTGPHSIEAFYSFSEALMQYPIRKFLCFMGTLGAQVIHQKEIALYFGIILLLSLISLLYINRNSLELDRFSKWYGLLAFGTLTSVEVALARSGSGSNWFGGADTIFFIPDVRHSLAIFLPIIGIYILSILYTKNSVANRTAFNNPSNFHNSLKNRVHQNIFLLGIVFTLITLGAILHVMPGIEMAESVHYYQMNNQYFLQTYMIQSDKNLENLYSEFSRPSDVIRENARYLEKFKLNIFAKEMLDLSKINKINAETYSNIDEINHKPINLKNDTIIIDKQKDEAIEITGWAVDKQMGRLAREVFITIDAELNIPTVYGLNRPDVADAYKNKNLRYSGFRASFASSILDHGPHNVTIKVVSKNGDGYYTTQQIIPFICI